MPADPDNDEPEPNRHGSGPIQEVIDVMLVVTNPSRHETLLRALERVAPQARIESTRNVFDALLRSRRERPTDLLILDHERDGGAAPSLIRHLARIGQHTAVMVFGDTAAEDPSIDVWPWAQAETALRLWLESRQAPPDA